MLGMAADSWGRYNIMIVTGFLSAILTFASIAANNTASILVVGGVYISHANTNTEGLIIALATV